MQPEFDISWISSEPNFNIDDSITKSVFFEKTKDIDLFDEFITNIMNNKFDYRGENLQSTFLISHDMLNFYDENDEDNEINTISNDRVELLTRKYIYKTLSLEESARLKILTKKLRQIIPLVENSEYDIVENIIDDLNKIHKNNINRKKMLGIK